MKKLLYLSIITLLLCITGNKRTYCQNPTSDVNYYLVSYSYDCEEKTNTEYGCAGLTSDSFDENMFLDSIRNELKKEVKLEIKNIKITGVYKFKNKQEYEYFIKKNKPEQFKTYNSENKHYFFSSGKTEE